MGVKINYLKKILVRYLLLSFAVLLLYPAISSLYVYGDLNVSNFLRFFEVFDYTLLILISLGLFLLLSSGKLRIEKFRIKSSLKYFLLFVVFLIISIHPYSNLNSYLSEGLHISSSAFQIEDNSIFFERNKWFNLKLLEFKSETTKTFIDGSIYDTRLAKVIYLNEVPDNPKLVWYGSWHGSLFNDNVFNPKINVFMRVNDDIYNVTNQYSELFEFQSDWMTLNLTKKSLNPGRNQLILFVQNHGGVGEDIGLESQTTFSEGKSFSIKGSESTLLEEEFLMYIPEGNSLLYTTSFKLSFLSGLLSLLFLVFAFFGTSFVGTGLKKAKSELIFSTLWMYLIAVFYVFTKEISVYLVKITAFGVYSLLKVSGLQTGIMVSDVENTLALNESTFAIGVEASGSIYMSYFLIIFAILLITKWKDFKIKETILFHFIGLLAVFLLNIINLYLLILIGEFLPGFESLAVKYLTEIFVLIFFLIYWPITLKYCTKNGKK